MPVELTKVSGGPIRTSIELNGAALNLFSQSQQNMILRSCMYNAAQLFIAVFLPKRFTEYATRFLGYTTTPKYVKRKEALARKGTISSPQPMPLVYTGASRADALNGARADARSTKSNPTAIIRFPRGAINYKKAAVLQNITSTEVDRMAKEFDKDLTELTASGINKDGKFPRTIVGAVSRIPPSTRQRHT